MAFKVLSLIIATALLGKAAIALAAPRRFYAVRGRQYASPTLPKKLMAAPALVLALAAAAWYAALFHYRPWGWIVVGFLTILAGLSLDHVFRWRAHRVAMLQVVESPKVWLVDCGLLALGSLFAALAAFVY